jgi:hypothetical protein
MKKKKSRIEMAREIIANLRLGMNRPATKPPRQNVYEATPFMPQPLPIVRNKRSSQLQTSHS